MTDTLNDYTVLMIDWEDCFNPIFKHVQAVDANQAYDVAVEKYYEDQGLNPAECSLSEFKSDECILLAVFSGHLVSLAGNCAIT